MDNNAVFFLPLPIVIGIMALATAVLIFRLEIGNITARRFFTSLFCLFAVESFLVGIRFGYGIESFIPIQRVLPLLAGPLMYLGFLALSLPSEDFKRPAILHMAATGVLMFVAAFLMSSLGDRDWLIAASYLFYTVALLVLWRKGADNLSNLRLDLPQQMIWWMLAGAGLLFVILIMDGLIALNFAFQRGEQAGALISYGSVFLAVFLLVIMMRLPRIMGENKEAAQQGQLAKSDADALEAQASEFLQSSQLYLEPDLTVQRLAKRLHVPVRSLSMAINQSRGMNVSQYVNGYRLEHAAQLLADSKMSVANVMERSGFLTRSNFYREFQRVYGQSPASYRQENRT